MDRALASRRDPAGHSGSKATPGPCRALIAMMPPHCTCIESHPGGGALMQRKPPAERDIGIDPDEGALAAFGRDHQVELIHGCANDILSSFPFRGTGPGHADPPCLQATRRSDRRYRFEMTGEGHAGLPEPQGPALPSDGIGPSPGAS